MKRAQHHALIAARMKHINTLLKTFDVPARVYHMPFEIEQYAFKFEGQLMSFFFPTVRKLENAAHRAIASRHAQV